MHFSPGNEVLYFLVYVSLELAYKFAIVELNALACSSTLMSPQISGSLCLMDCLRSSSDKKTLKRWFFIDKRVG